MLTHSIRLRGMVLILALLGVTLLPGNYVAADNDKLAEPITKGLRVFTCGHSFHVWVPGIVADLSIVHAWMGDHEGNLVYRKTARNFNPMMATSGKMTVAQVEHLVRPGEIDPDHIITPGVYVKRIIHVPNAVKHIEQRTVRKREAAAATGEEV